MKTTIQRRFAACNEARDGVYCAQTAASNEADWQQGWMLIAPYGDQANAAVDLKTGERTRIVQRFTPDDAAAVVNDFKALSTRIRRFFAGVNLHHGHPDMPGPGRTAKQARDAAASSVIGTITELEARPDGLWAKAALNEKGAELLETTKGLCPSTYWWMTPEAGEGEPKVMRPYTLKSVGLVPNPNLATAAVNQEPDMKKSEIIAALRKAGREVGDDAAESDLLGAIEGLGADRTAAVNAKTTEEQALAAANIALADERTAREAAEERARKAEEAKTQAEAAASNARAEAVTAAVHAAVETGRITLAEADTWKGRLAGANGAAEREALDKLPVKFRVIPRGSAIDAEAEKTGLMQRRKADEAIIAAVNEAFEAHPKKTTDPQTAHREAFQQVQREKPQLFGRAG
jgi:hypothetical protein